jgi:signal transduction histidine kinase
VFAVPAQAKGVALRTHRDPALPDALLGDGLRLQQVLMNLLSNATKFTDRGRIDLAVSWLGGDAAAAAPTVRLSVSDTGPGVPEELIPRLFQEFEQARTAAPAAAAGAGLGLALCRQFVHLMGGQIGVDNRPGQGSTFWCLLPLQTA